MTTGAYFNRLGEQRISTALLCQRGDSAAGRAAAKWALGSKARYRMPAGYAQFVESGKPVQLARGGHSHWGYFNRLGEQRITNSLFMQGSSSAARKAATQWTFYQLRRLSVGSSVGAYTLTGKPVTLTYTQGSQPVAPATGPVGQASRVRGGRLIQSSVYPPAPLVEHYVVRLEPGAFLFTGHPVKLTIGETPQRKRNRDAVAILVMH